MEVLEIFNTLNVFIGFITPIVVQYIAPKLYGWQKLAVAILFCVAGGGVIVGVNGGWSSWEIGNIFQQVSAVFIIAEASWKGVWKSVLQDY